MCGTKDLTGLSSPKFIPHRAVPGTPYTPVCRGTTGGRALRLTGKPCPSRNRFNWARARVEPEGDLSCRPDKRRKEEGRFYCTGPGNHSYDVDPSQRFDLKPPILRAERRGLKCVPTTRTKSSLLREPGHRRPTLHLFRRDKTEVKLCRKDKPPDFLRSRPSLQVLVDTVGDGQCELLWFRHQTRHLAPSPP